MMTSAEREFALKQMEQVVSGFYRAAIQIGNHPFIEFAGVMTAYVKSCQRAHDEGVDFTECNQHSGQALPMETFEVVYLAEKLDCIFGGRIQAVAQSCRDLRDPGLTGKPRYKNQEKQNFYLSLLTLAGDRSSELYHDGRPRRGAGHRAAFWDGYGGLKRTANVVPGTLSAVAYAAGQQFAKTNPGIPKEEAVWTPGITRQGDPTKVL